MFLTLLTQDKLPLRVPLELSISRRRKKLSEVDLALSSQDL